MRMSRGISPVGLNRRQGGDTGDSTPDPCSWVSVNLAGRGPTESIGRSALHGWKAPVQMHARRRRF